MGLDQGRSETALTVISRVLGVIIMAASVVLDFLVFFRYGFRGLVVLLVVQSLLVPLVFAVIGFAAMAVNMAALALWWLVFGRLRGRGLRG